MSPRGVLRGMELGAQIPSSPQSVNRALHRHKFLSMRHRVCILTHKAFQKHLFHP